MQLIPITNLDNVGIDPGLSADDIKTILESKRPVLGEIELTLFENCNIECDFCFHDKKSTVGLTREEMLSKLPLVADHLDKLKGRVQLVQINMVGGELFQDQWMEEKCGDYKVLLLEIQKLANDRNLKLQTVWVSNFLWKKREVIRDLMDFLNENEIKSTLIASYDLTGRPISNRYHTNLKYFKDYISTINLVATKQSIAALASGTDEFFDELYAEHEVYFDDFIPDVGSEWQIPSETQMLQFYKLIADKYPRAHPIAAIIKNKENEMHCLALNKVTIFPDNTVSNCRWHRYTQADFKTTLDLRDNSGMMYRFMEENGCLSCDYYSRCGFSCYTQWDWRRRERDLGSCVMRSFFDYLETK